MTECDLLVMGAGVLGLSVAYELSGHGWRVRVVDRGEIGQEASWAGAGILPPANRRAAVHPLDHLRALSFELHPRWASQLREQTGVDNGFRRCGAIYVARSRGEAACLHAAAREWTELGISCRPIAKPEQLIALEPGLAHSCGTGNLIAAYELPEEAQLRNPRHLQALRTACERRGVEFLTHDRIVGFEVGRGQLREVQSERGPLRAQNYCVTTGAWTFALLKQLGITTGIMPIRGQMILFRRNPPPLRRIINEGSRYLVPRDDGYVLAGSTEEEAGFDKSTTPEGVADLLRFSETLVPTLSLDAIDRTWAGLRPGSFDGLPYIGRLPGFENAFAAAGHFRSGLYLSPGTAVVLGQVMRGKTPDIDLAPFRVGRG